MERLDPAQLALDAYDAAVNPARWFAFAQNILCALGVSAVGLLDWGGPVFAVGTVPAPPDDWRSSARNPGIRIAQSAPVTTIQRVDDLVRIPIEFKFGIEEHLIGINIVNDGNSVVTLAINSDFRVSDRALRPLQIAQRHVAQAFRFMRQLDSSSLAGLLAFDGTKGIYALDDVGEHTLRTHPWLTHHATNVRVSASLQATDSTSRGSLKICANDVDMAHCTLVHDTKLTLLPSRTGTRIIVGSPQKDAWFAQHLAEHFGLTSAEARVGVALLRGGSVASIARERALSRNTVRTHLYRMFDKMGVRRQTELVVLLREIEASCRL